MASTKSCRHVPPSQSTSWKPQSLQVCTETIAAAGRYTNTLPSVSLQTRPMTAHTFPALLLRNVSAVNCKHTVCGATSCNCCSSTPYLWRFTTGACVCCSTCLCTHCWWHKGCHHRPALLATLGDRALKIMLAGSISSVLPRAASDLISAGGAE